jgi:hypothetical protein
MARYFFHTSNGHRCPDNEGVELDTMAEVQAEAARGCGELLKETAETFWQTQDLTMTVTDDGGLILFTVEIIATMSPAAAGTRYLRPG